MNKSEKAQHLISLFFSTGRLIKESSRGEDHLDPISILNIETLKLIESESPTMKRVANYLHIKAPSATHLINDLVMNGYVRRVSSESDRRVVQIRITPDGSKFLKNGLKEATKGMQKILMLLSEKQMDNYIQIIEEIHKAYDKRTK